MNDFFEKIPIVAPTPTPFTNDEVNYEKLSNNIEKWHNTSISGFVLGSHGGEELHTSIDEKRQIIDTVVETNNKKKVIIFTGKLNYSKGYDVFGKICLKLLFI